MIRVYSYLNDNCKIFACWAFAVLTTMLIISCGEKDTSPQKAQLKKPDDIDFFASRPQTTIKINNIEYTIIDDYTKWIPVLYIKKDFEEVEKHIFDLLNIRGDV